MSTRCVEMLVWRLRSKVWRKDVHRVWFGL